MLDMQKLKERARKQTVGLESSFISTPAKASKKNPRDSERSMYDDPEFSRFEESKMMDSER